MHASGGLLLLLASAGRAAPTDLYVNCFAGNDSSDGLTPQTAFLSPNRARDVIRTLQPLSVSISVHIAAGDCFARDENGAVNASLPVLSLEGPADGGTGADATVSYIGAGANATRLLGGVPIPPTLWQVWRGPILSLDLRAAGFAYGLGDMRTGGLGTCSNDKVELFFGGVPQVLARYPNILPNGTWAFANVRAVSANNASAYVFSVRGDAATHASRWAAEADAWLYGYWTYNWGDNHVRLLSATPSGDGTAVTLSIDPKTPPLYGLAPGARFLGINLLSELDAPGEYYVDRTSSILYFYPPSPIASAEAFLSVAEAVVVIGGSAAVTTRAPLRTEGREFVFEFSTTEAADASPAVWKAWAAAAHAVGPVAWVVIQGFRLAFARGDGLVAAGVDHVTAISIDTVAHGRVGATLSTSTHSSFVNVTSTATGCGALAVSGGDVMTLTPGNNTVSGAVLHDYGRWVRSCTPGIAWFGSVGSRFESNEVFSAPHMGMFGSGNDCTFEGNHLHDLCYGSSDAGAWYQGRSWIARGTVLRSNTFEDVRVREAGVTG